MDSRPERTFQQGVTNLLPAISCSEKRTNTSLRILKARARLATSRGQINGQVVISIKRMAQVVKLNSGVQY